MEWYQKNTPQKWAAGRSPVLSRGHKGEWKLTTTERKRILLANIYGVDIDSQAVEVTKLSLLLKVLEGENEQTLSRQLKLFRERALPDLGNNIKCGNSLIGPDFSHWQQLSLLNEEEVYRINAFDWKTEFPEAMKSGGFDAVIGNPPYIRIQALKEWAPIEVEVYKKHYPSAGKGNYDIYVVFVEKGLSLLNPKGRLGFILPHKFFNSQYGQPLRTLISKGNHLSKVVHFGDQQVFAGATTYTCLLFLNKGGINKFELVKAIDLIEWRGTSQEKIDIVSSNSTNDSVWTFDTGKNARLFERLSKMPTKLGDVTDRIFQGLVTGADSVFILSWEGKGKYLSDATKQRHHIESNIMHPLCKGSVNIRRYHISEVNKSILFPYKEVQGKAVLLSTRELTIEYPQAWEYLKANREILEERERGKWKNDRWYAFGRSQNLNEMDQKKILTPSIAKSASFTLDASDFYYFVGSGGGGGGGYGITLKPEKQTAYEYILGLLNSKLLDNFLKSISSTFSGGYYAYNRQYIEQLPIRLINFSDPNQKAMHDRMVTFVEKIQSLHKQLPLAKTDQERTVLQRQIDTTDHQIDQLVYELYELTEEEIKLVEETTNRN